MGRLKGETLISKDLSLKQELLLDVTSKVRVSKKDSAAIPAGRGGLEQFQNIYCVTIIDSPKCVNIESRIKIESDNLNTTLK